MTNPHLNWIHCWVRDWAHWSSRNRLEIHKMLKVKGTTLIGSGGASTDFDTLVTREDLRIYRFIDLVMGEIEPRLAKAIDSHYIAHRHVEHEVLEEALAAVEAGVIERGVIKPPEYERVVRRVAR